jgi:hypothetical protein
VTLAVLYVLAVDRDGVLDTDFPGSDANETGESRRGSLEFVRYGPGSNMLVSPDRRKDRAAHRREGG